MSDPYNGIKFPSEREVKIRELAQQLLQELNAYGHDEILPAFSDEVRRGHRTLQQILFKAILVLLKDWAKDAEEHRFDGRNEFTVETAAKLVEHLKEWNVLYEGKALVPFI